ncbi:hypothetical protein [Halorussus pelagicus]|uniref:hypothetical protein n=1 Tax=Halorussus pelagicus TaxID=2505977 RepID=UPI000FFB44E4|nr:hypothetical protein [Halorussus pelagicus]
MQHPSSNSPKRESSLVHFLFVWFLVGSSFFGPGWNIADAAPVSIPISSMEVGLLFGTVVVAVLWVAGFRPSISASGGYFIAETGLHYLLILGWSLFLPFEETLPVWQDVSLSSLSIALAAALVFTSTGRQARHFIWKHGRKLVKTSPT